MALTKPTSSATQLPDIIIVPAAALRAKVSRSGWPFRMPIGSVLSLENPGYKGVAARYPKEADQVKRGFAPRLKDMPAVAQLILAVQDSHVPHTTRPATLSTIHSIAAFAGAHMAERPLMKFAVQCAQGISRSTATCLTVEAAFHEASGLTCDPAAMVQRLLKRRPSAAPDETIVSYTDQVFHFRGKLIAAVDLHPQIRANRDKHRSRIYGANL